MVSYRRVFVPGGCYFLTLTLANRHSTLLTDQIGLLKESFKYALSRYLCHIHAISIMPEHLHMLIQLPEQQCYYPKFVQSMKSRFSRGLTKKSPTQCQPIWQSRYWEHCIRDECDWLNHLDYIHRNPYKHGLVKQVSDWPYSSFHAYVKKGILPDDWLGEEDVNGDFGELS
ncbi:REP-associated tyrosine transposase [Celerinatantimonas yamalensis]|uniref:Transposase n=1 Tax=Celerinatantimonas yamalensis TaxID=559956 RepID=A0ABW9G4W2_9GAMM